MWGWLFAVLFVPSLAKDACSSDPSHQELHGLHNDQSTLVQLAYAPEGQVSPKMFRTKNDVLETTNQVPATSQYSEVPNFQNAQKRAGAVVDAIFPSVSNSSRNFMSHIDSVTFATAVVVLGGLDIYVCPTMTRSHVGQVASVFLMITLSVLYNAAVWLERGKADAVQWASGYAFEWLLSFDNLFAFFLVFRAFRVPDTQVQRVLVVGVYGAAILRVIFFLFLREAMDASLWVDEAVGVLLIVSGVGAIFETEDAEEQRQPEPPWVACCFKWIFGTRLMETYDDAGCIFTHDGEQWRMTMLMLTACVIMIVDILFALDSVGVKSHEFSSVYLNVSSSIMAMFTLRQAYFVISALADTFAYFKFGIAAVLVIIGTDLVMSPWGGVDKHHLSLMIVASFAMSILASLVRGHVEAANIKSKAEAWRAAEQSATEQFVWKSAH